MTSPSKAPKKPLPKPPVPPRPKKPPAPPPQWAKPNVGLSTPTPVKTEAEGQTGGWAKSETERSYTRDGSGKINGTQTVTESVAGAGARGSTTRSTDVSDGRTTTKTEGKAEGLAGAEAAVKFISLASEEELKLAVDAITRAGVFGALKGETSISRGPLSTSARGGVEGGSGAQATFAAMARVDRSGLIPAIEALINASAQAGVWGKAEGEIAAAVGPLSAKIVAEVSGMIGVSASAAAKLCMTWKGVEAEFKASAFAGAKSEGSATAELALGPAQLEVSAGYTAMAGAEAQLKAKLAVGLEGVSAKFKASAFAGAKVEGKASGAVKIRGKTIVSAKGKVSVMAGVGAELEGEFEIKGGKLKIGGALGAALKGGVGVGAKAEIDFYALADVIIAEIGDMAKGDELKITAASPGYKREPIADPVLAEKKRQSAYETVIDDFRAYANKKSTGGEHGVKKERVQAIIQNRAGQLHSDFAFVETDEGITQAAKDAFGPMLKDIVVQAGYIRAFDPAPQAVVTKHKEDFQQQQTWRAARDALVNDLRAYGDKTDKNGKPAGITRTGVQKIIEKHWKQVQAAFPGTEADQLVIFAVNMSLDRYLAHFDFSDGEIRAFDAPQANAQAAKKAATDDAAAQSRGSAMTQLQAKLATYKAGLVNDEKKNLDKAAVAKLVTSATSKIKDQLDKPEANNEIVSTIVSTLAPLVEASGVKVVKGVLTELTAKSGGLGAARQAKKDGDEQNAQAAAITSLARSLSNYLETKTKQGANGVKQEEVQKRIDTCTAKVQAWVHSGKAADDQLTETVVENLKGMVTSATVTDGKVTLTAPAALAARVKQERKQNGKARLGGEEDDNQRRRMVSDALRGEFAAYAAKVRASAESAKAGQAPKTRLERAKLQSIIDKRTKTIRADIVNDVGDEAVMTTAQDTFGPMLKYIWVVNLNIAVFDPENDFAKITKAKRDESAQARTAIADLEADLRSYAAASEDTGRMPAKAVVQAVIDKHKAKFSSMDEDEADIALEMAVHNAFRDRIRSVKIHGGTLHFFLLSVASTGAH